MSSGQAIWTSLEVTKLAVDVLTPLVVALCGWYINRRLKRLDFAQWSSQKVIEKRLLIYDQIAPKINALLCFFTWVGFWKDVSPADAVRYKRELDKEINIYRHLFEEDVYRNYQTFIHLLFETYNGPGHDAKLRATVDGPDGDRRTQCNYEWDEAWRSIFSDSPQIASKSDVRSGYNELMKALTKAVGVRT